MKWIPLSQDQLAIVDEPDYHELIKYKWHVTSHGYACAVISGKRVYMHRLIMRAAKGVEVDHANGYRLDNRRSNLRLATRAQNQYNRIRGSHSPYRGVRKIYNRWAARIRYKNKEVHLGYYATPEEAASAYNKAAEQYHGEFAVLNIIEGVPS